MSVTPAPTSDLYDEHGEALALCTTQFRQFGGRRLFAGPVRTVSCHEDNALLRELVSTPGGGAVLVVDGGGSCARPSPATSSPERRSATAGRA